MPWFRRNKPKIEEQSKSGEQTVKTEGVFRKCPECEAALYTRELQDSLQHLFDYLRGRGCIVPLDDVALEHLDIRSPDVLDLIARGSDEWVQMVPDCVAKKIKKQRLFGFSA